MTDKPEALKWADELEKCWADPGLQLRAAAELRRLHEAHDWQYRMAGERLRRIEKLERERDDLLAALNAMLTHMGMDEDEWNKPTFEQARAAISRAEGSQK